MSGFDDIIGGKDHPDRPDVPEFWHLSEIVLQHDGRTGEERDTGFMSIVEEHIPYSVLVYMAKMRALIFFGTNGITPDQVPVKVLSEFMGMYVDGFVTGAAYAKRYPREKS